MAIIRMAAGAVLITLTTLVAAAPQAQAQKAPLQLVPGADQAQTSTRAATTQTTKAAKTVAKTSNKATRTATSRKNTRQAAVAAAQPLSKAARTVASAPRAILRGAAPAPQVFAQGSDDKTPADNVMRGGDSISLIARLPWWRNDRLQEVQYGSVAAENAVMAAAGVWLAANGGEPAADRAPGQTLALAAPEEAIEIADAGQINDIDLAAEETPAPPAPTFLQSLVALLGGVAAAAAASARFLFV
jgi:hypothetical protein